MIRVDRPLAQRGDVPLQVGIGARLEQQVDHRGVPLGGGPHQRRRLLHLLGGVDVDLVLEQHRDRGHLAGSRGGHQCRFAPGMRARRVGARLEQDGHHRGVAGTAGVEERGDAVAVGGVDVGTAGDQRPGDLAVTGVRGPEQRRRAVAGSHVRVHPLRQERADGRHIARLHSFRQRAVASRAHGARQRRDHDTHPNDATHRSTLSLGFLRSAITGRQGHSRLHHGHAGAGRF